MKNNIKNKEFAIFKYEKYQCTEACSEKLSYEIAKLLRYKCAKIELARDKDILASVKIIFNNN